jgi:hypothetical protein
VELFLPCLAHTTKSVDLAREAAIHLFVECGQKYGEMFGIVSGGVVVLTNPTGAQGAENTTQLEAILAPRPRLLHLRLFLARTDQRWPLGASAEIRIIHHSRIICVLICHKLHY